MEIAKSIRLPYQAHPEGGLLVIHAMALTEEVTFICPCYYIFHDRFKCWLMPALDCESGEEFMPAVEIPAAGDEYLRGYLYKYKPLPELQPDQFWEDDFLICPHAEDDKDNPEDRWAIGAELDNRSLCGSCGGGGLIQEYGELYCCPKCGGWGSI